MADPGMTRTLLAIYMTAYLEQAAGDLLGKVPPDELFERFVAWTR